jgi:hypothetical protein
MPDGPLPLAGIPGEGGVHSAIVKIRVYTDCEMIYVASLQHET